MSTLPASFPTATQARQTARDYTVVFTEINAIESAIIQAIRDYSYSTVISNNTPMTSTSGIIGVNIVNGGTEYCIINPEASVSHPSGVNAVVTLTLTGGTISAINVINGGTGYSPINATVSSVTRISNANASITLGQTLGVIDGYAIVSAGQGYHVNDALVITDGSGSNASVVVASVGSLGEILTLSIINGGSNYASPSVSSINRISPVDASLIPVVTDGVISSITISNGGAAYHVGDEVVIAHPHGIGAVVQVGTIDANGSILTLNIVSGGSNYGEVVATVVIAHPSGAGFRSTAVVSSGVITKVIVDDGGIGYQPLLPTIVANDTTGTGATFTFTRSAGTFTEVSVVNKGQNYSQSTTLSVIPALTSPGHGAVLTPVLESFTTSVAYYNAYKNISTSRELSDQLQFVLDYFTNFGYNIKLQTNPLTQNTLQWSIMW